MKRCKNCVLPETFPGIRFNEDGICSYCLNFKGGESLREKKDEYKKRFQQLIKKHRGRGTYDALMSYSGGKDSTYVLSILRRDYGLNVLAVTFDNGFLPDQTFRNIQTAAENLGFDHVIFKPRFDLLRRIFQECSKQNIYSPQTLVRASTICTSCMAVVKFTSLRMALESRVPFIVFGWSPGQIPLASSIMKNNPKMIKMTQKTLFEPLYRLVGDEIRPYFLEERHFQDEYFYPYNLSPLGFLDYDEEKILEAMSRLGWKAPEDVDAHSTNCLLNSFANVVHRERYGYHPYVFELAKLVREGHMRRDEALKRLDKEENPKTVELVKRKLRI
jgi:tRNA(Ile)-lysidine synthase TilS/MesJ